MLTSQQQQWSCQWASIPCGLITVPSGLFQSDPQDWGAGNVTSALPPPTEADTNHQHRVVFAAPGLQFVLLQFRTTGLSGQLVWTGVTREMLCSLRKSAAPCVSSLGRVIPVREPTWRGRGMPGRGMRPGPHLRSSRSSC